MAEYRCVECLWFDLTVDLNRGSHNTCLKTGKTLPASVLGRRGCREFRTQTGAPHWGP